MLDEMESHFPEAGEEKVRIMLLERGSEDHGV